MCPELGRQPRPRLLLCAAAARRRSSLTVGGRRVCSAPAKRELLFRRLQGLIYLTDALGTVAERRQVGARPALIRLELGKGRVGSVEFCLQSGDLSRRLLALD